MCTICLPLSAIWILSEMHNHLILLYINIMSTKISKNNIWSLSKINLTDKKLLYDFELSTLLINSYIIY